MQAFILRQNIERFRNLLVQEERQAERRTLRELLATALREQAVLLASRDGFEMEVDPLQAVVQRRVFRDKYMPLPQACLLLDPRKGLHIVEINDAYGSITMTQPALVIGRSIFEVFPDNPADPDADGIANLYASLKRVAERHTTDVTPVQRYDMRSPAGGFLTKFWKMSNQPILSEDESLVYFLQSLEDITKELLYGPASLAQTYDRNACGNSEGGYHPRSFEASAAASTRTTSSSSS
ncbi:PAS domain-containing protein [Ensifer sp. SL37]|uniref:PAS domain-containing protein n=1 Tax=Ensifer sp. SL37 TaxID=2995137 RepID=UPI002276AC18|nr:PAS domain-containing protein [Ensifer sp. SL37]MCY1746289.1 PAS domain-containing protein [Ensifer sp. SL37]